MTPDEEELADLRQQMDDVGRRLFERDGWRVSGWVYVAEVQRIDPNAHELDLEPLAFSSRYTVGPGTSATSGLGLLEALAALFRRVAMTDFRSPDMGSE